MSLGYVLCGLLISASAATVRDGAPVFEADKPFKFLEVHNQKIFAFAWRTPLVETGFFRSIQSSAGQPAISRQFERIIVGTGEGNVVAFALQDGARVWTYEHGTPFESAVTLCDVERELLEGKEIVEVALISSRSGALLALLVSSGELLWRVELGGEVRSPTVIDGALAIVATANQRVMAIELANGHPVWEMGRPPHSSLSVRGHAKPLLDNGTVYASFSDGYVEAYQLEDGSLKWSRPLSLRGGDFADADADPVLENGRLFVASYSDGVYALDPQDGQALWQQPALRVTTLIPWGKTILAGTGTGWVFGMHQEDGRLLHRTRFDNGPVTRFALQDNLLVFTSGEDGLIALSAREGRPLQSTNYRVRFDNDVTWQHDYVSMISANGFLYLFTRMRTSDFSLPREFPLLY